MSGPMELTAGGVRWHVGPAWLDGVPGGDPGVLFGPGGLRLPEWLAAGRASVVKAAPHRTVYRVALPGLDFHLKHYPVYGGRAWLRSLVRPSKGRAEYERTDAVAGRGVPTLVPLGYGETAGGGSRASYLATRTLPNAGPLDAFLERLPLLPPARRTRLRQRLAAALGRLLARMHQAGVTHHDLHPGNLLLRLAAADTPSLHLIDLHAAHVGAPLSWRARRANLVVFNRWFALRAERSDRLRFWHAYEEAIAGGAGVPPAKTAGGTPAPRQESRRRVRDLERRTLESNLRFWRHQDGRCLGTNRYFRRFRTGAVRGHAVADLDPAALAPLLADPDAPFRPAPGVTVLKHSPSASVVELDLAGPAGPRRVILKRFALRRRLDPWAALVRPAPPLRSFVLGHGLRLRCLPTPRPLAVWHRYRLGLPREGYLLTEKVPDAVDLLAFVARLDCLPAARRRESLRGLIDQVGRLVAALHERRLSQRDLKASNLLVSPEQWFVSAKGTREGAPDGSPGSAEPQVWFIDLVGVRRHRKLGRRRRVQNLARLHASFHNHPALTRTDKLRFLRAYLRRGLRGRLGWKQWWRQVEEATRDKVRRNLRSGRPLG